MAKAVKLGKGKEITFASRSGARSQYEWDKWFNPDPQKFPGGLVMLEQSAGEKDDKGNVVNVTEKGDFSISVKAMALKVRFAARKRWKVAQVSMVDADDKKLENALIIRTRPMDDTERRIEESRRSEKKLAKLRRKEAKEAAEEAGDVPPTADE